MTFHPRYDFYNSKKSHLCFVTPEDILAFDFQKFFEGIFSNYLGYLSTTQKSLQVSQIFIIFEKLYAR